METYTVIQGNQLVWHGNSLDEATCRVKLLRIYENLTADRPFIVRNSDCAVLNDRGETMAEELERN